MKNFILFLSIIIVAKKSQSQVGSDIEHNYLVMEKCIVAIGTVVIDTFLINGKAVAMKNFRTIGTGLVTYAKIDTFRPPCIVTAGHVVKFFSKNKLQQIYLRPSWADTIPTNEYLGIPIPVVNEGNVPNTYLYPEPHVDLGCILWLPNYNDKLAVSQFKKGASNLLFPYNQMTVPYLGDQVWVGGYPQHIQTSIQSSFPYTISTFKPAYVAWKPSANMTNADLSHITLIESNATHGNSGGPVFSMHGSLDLVGILTGGYEETDSVYLNNKAVVDPGTHQALVTKVRAGVSIIERAEYVRKLMDYVNERVAKYFK